VDDANLDADLGALALDANPGGGVLVLLVELVLFVLHVFVFVFVFVFVLVLVVFVLVKFVFDNNKFVLLSGAVVDVRRGGGERSRKSKFISVGLGMLPWSVARWC